MYTLDKSPKTRFPLKDYEAINITFPTDDTDVRVGTAVKLLSTGKVERVAAATDLPIGVTITHNSTYGTGGSTSAASGAGVTVQTNFKGVVCMRATAAVAVGAEVAVSGYDSATENSNVTTAVATNVVFGIALTEAAAAGDIIEVGILPGMMVKA